MSREASLSSIGDVRIDWRPDGVRYVSGLTIYDEALIDGRWIGRTWGASGYVMPEKDIADELRRRRRILPTAFLIEVDGQNLGGHWTWVGFIAAANWGEEGDFRWEPITGSRTSLVGRRGRSGFSRPSTFLRNELTGESAILDLAWSGNWSLHLDRIEEQFLDLPVAERLLLVSIGPDGESPQRLIEPGETVKTPSVHVGYLHGDLDATVQALHAHVRRSVLPAQPPDRGQRIQVNHWGYVADRVSSEQLRRDIDVAAAAGGELYIVDAGWFGSQPGEWWVTVGDWESGAWLEGGIEATRAYAREKGLLFGLWMEPETVGGKSRLYAEHPDWVLRRDGLPVGRAQGARDRFALDLAKPEVAAWMESEMDRLVATYDLDLLRIDYNLDVWAGGETLRGACREFAVAPPAGALRRAGPAAREVPQPDH